MLRKDLIKAIGGYLSLELSHMWLPWRGVATQIRIENEPHLKHMITKYDHPNEVAYFETKIGVYRREEIMNFSMFNHDFSHPLEESDLMTTINQQVLI